MKRTQIALTAEQHRNARRKAAELQISLGEYIRRLVERDMSRVVPPVDISVVFDLGGSGASNVAADKDAMVADALDALHPRRAGPTGSSA